MKAKLPNWIGFECVVHRVKIAVSRYTALKYVRKLAMRAEGLNFARPSLIWLSCSNKKVGQDVAVAVVSTICYPPSLRNGSKNINLPPVAKAMLSATIVRRSRSTETALERIGRVSPVRWPNGRRLEEGESCPSIAIRFGNAPECRFSSRAGADEA